MRTAALLLALLACCATTTRRGRAVRVVSQAQLVVGCRYLGTVRGSSVWGDSAGSSIGLELAQSEAKERAAKLGGNMLLKQSERSGTISTFSGDAYRCRSRGR